jgi:hypothetical protein
VNVFSFDTSAFINGRRDLLPPEVFPTLWGNVEEMIAAGQVRSVDVVRDELDVRDDDTCKWARAQPDLFVDLTLEVQKATRQVLRTHPKLMGVGGQRNGADPFVIGFALAYGGTVVTEERLQGSVVRPHIPDVCAALAIPWMNLVTFARNQGWSF